MSFSLYSHFSWFKHFLVLCTITITFLAPPYIKIFINIISFLACKNLSSSLELSTIKLYVYFRLSYLSFTPITFNLGRFNFPNAAGLMWNVIFIIYLIFKFRKVLSNFLKALREKELFFYSISSFPLMHIFVALNMFTESRCKNISSNDSASIKWFFL